MTVQQAPAYQTPEMDIPQTQTYPGEEGITQTVAEAASSVTDSITLPPETLLQETMTRAEKTSEITGKTLETTGMISETGEMTSIKAVASAIEKTGQELVTGKGGMKSPGTTKEVIGLPALETVTPSPTTQKRETEKTDQELAMGNGGMKSPGTTKEVVEMPALEMVTLPKTDIETMTQKREHKHQGTTLEIQGITRIGTRVAAVETTDQERATKKQGQEH